MWSEPVPPGRSATNSVLGIWVTIFPACYNKRQGGVVLGSKIAPIFFNTVERFRGLPVECPVDQMNMGDVIVIKPYAGVVENEAGESVSSFP